MGGVCVDGVGGGVGLGVGVLEGVEVDVVEGLVLVAVDGAFDGVFEFADVAVPGVLEEEGLGVGGDLGGVGELEFVGHACGEVLGEEEDVFGACAEGGEVEDFEGESVEEVVHEASLLGEGGEVGVGGADDADVDGDGFVAADALEVAVFDDAEDFFLYGEGDVAEFVEEEGAVVGLFEEAGASFVCAGEGAGFVAEEFGFDEAGAEGGAVELDEGFLPAWGEVVEVLCGEFFAGAAFADEEEGSVDGGDAGEVFLEVEEGFGLAEGLGGGVFVWGGHGGAPVAGGDFTGRRGGWCVGWVWGIVGAWLCCGRSGCVCARCSWWVVWRGGSLGRRFMGRCRRGCRRFGLGCRMGVL